MTGNTPFPDPNRSSRPPMRGGGCLIALGLVVGPLVGLYFHQTTLGLVLGFGIGAGAALVLAVFDRRR